MKIPQFGPARRHIRPFDDPHWLFELKHDGIRALAVFQQGRVRFLSRQGAWLSGYAPLAAAITRHLSPDEAILDGTIAAPDKDGRTALSRLLQKPEEARFYAFDLVWLNGQDTRAIPLLRRKERLRELLPPRSRRLVYVEHILEHGTVLHRIACRYGFQGIIAKRADIAYDTMSMRSGWIEIHNPRYGEAIDPGASKSSPFRRRTAGR
jgi:bifunctional non-homologous end joining protein LigD